MNLGVGDGGDGSRSCPQAPVSFSGCRAVSFSENLGCFPYNFCLTGMLEFCSYSTPLLIRFNFFSFLIL